jgi:hypothetical protein
MFDNSGAANRWAVDDENYEDMDALADSKGSDTGTATELYEEFAGIGVAAASTADNHYGAGLTSSSPQSVHVEETYEAIESAVVAAANNHYDAGVSVNAVQSVQANEAYLQVESETGADDTHNNNALVDQAASTQANEAYEQIESETGSDANQYGTNVLMPARTVVSETRFDGEQRVGAADVESDVNDEDFEC